MCSGAAQSGAVILEERLRAADRRSIAARDRDAKAGAFAERTRHIETLPVGREVARSSNGGEVCPRDRSKVLVGQLATAVVDEPCVVRALILGRPTRASVVVDREHDKHVAVPLVERGEWIGNKGELERARRLDHAIALIARQREAVSGSCRSAGARARGPLDWISEG